VRRPPLGMDFRHAFEENTVARHGEIDARTDRVQLAIAPKQESAITAESQLAALLKTALCGGVCDGLVFGHFAQRHRVDVSHVHRDVHNRHDDDSKHHRAGHVAAWIFDFACDPGDIHPAVIRPENGNQSDPIAESNWLGLMPMAMPALPACSAKCPNCPCRRQIQELQRRHGNELCPGSDVLKQGATPQPDDVDPGDDDNGKQSTT